MPPIQKKAHAGEGMVDTATDGVPAADSLRKVLRILLFVFSGVVEQTGQLSDDQQSQIIELAKEFVQSYFSK